MRSKDKDKPWRNYYDMMDVAKAVGSLVNVRPKDISHIFRLGYLVTLHQMSNNVIDSDSRLEEVKIEIPYYGELKLKISNGKVIGSEFDPEDELVSDINRVVNTGESALIDEARKAVGNRIIKKYKELL